MSLDLYRILERPLITEKGTLMAEHGNWVLFEVNRKANKLQVKEAVEKIFKVKVLDVNTLNVKSKKKRTGRNMGETRAWKKAMVLLKDGEKIEFFEGN